MFEIVAISATIVVLIGIAMVARRIKRRRRFNTNDIYPMW